MLGLALMQRKKYAEGIKALERVYKLYKVYLMIIFFKKKKKHMFYIFSHIMICSLWILEEEQTLVVTWWRRYGKSYQEQNTKNGNMIPPKDHGICKSNVLPLLLLGFMWFLNNYHYLETLLLDTVPYIRFITFKIHSYF